MARTRTGEPAALSAGDGADLTALQQQLRAALISGADTRGIRDQIASAEAHQRARDELLAGMQDAAANRLVACSATRASARVFGANVDLAARLAKLAPPPHPFRR